MMPEVNCGVCGSEMLTAADKKKKICISCSRRGHRTPMLDRRAYVIPMKMAGVIRMIDTESRTALVEFIGRNRKDQPKKWKRTRPFWETKYWVQLNDIRLWTKKRAKMCKTDNKMWRSESMP
jgi:hypothetical protein